MHFCNYCDTPSPSEEHGCIHELNMKLAAQNEKIEKVVELVRNAAVDSRMGRLGPTQVEELRDAIDTLSLSRGPAMARQFLNEKKAAWTFAVAMTKALISHVWVHWKDSAGIEFKRIYRDWLRCLMSEIPRKDATNEFTQQVSTTFKELDAEVKEADVF